jgi:hypothetical protein
MSRSTKLNSFWLKLGLGLCVMAMLVVWLILPKPGINHANFLRIQTGMTTEEVTAIMGKQPGDYSSDISFLWSAGERWGNSEGLQHDWHWVSDEGMIGISLDSNGRVNGASFQPAGLREPPESLLGRIRKLLGI